MSRRHWDDEDERVMPYEWPEEVRDACDAEFGAIDWEDYRGPRINVYQGHWIALDPTQIDGDAVSWYRHGNCALLAHAIHSATGWPLVLLVGTGSMLSDRPYPWFHAGVRTPDGRFVDILGAHDSDASMLADWRAEYRALGIVSARDVTEEEFSEATGHSPVSVLDQYSDVERTVTKHFAQMVVAQVMRSRLHIPAAV